MLIETSLKEYLACLVFLLVDTGSWSDVCVHDEVNHVLTQGSDASTSWFPTKDQKVHVTTTACVREVATKHLSSSCPYYKFLCKLILPYQSLD